MTDTKTSAARPTTDIIRTHAERLAFEEHERAQRRRLELAEQRSDLNSPEVRIRAWEKVHALRLPTDPDHPVLDVVAMGTGLTLAQVREEQKERAARRNERTQTPKASSEG
jgi:hypothetical protein